MVCFPRIMSHAVACSPPALQTLGHMQQSELRVSATGCLVLGNSSLDRCAPVLAGQRAPFLALPELYLPLHCSVLGTGASCPMPKKHAQRRERESARAGRRGLRAEGSGKRERERERERVRVRVCV
eukprot:680183-Rhodomonas_salina.1